MKTEHPVTPTSEPMFTSEECISAAGMNLDAGDLVMFTDSDDKTWINLILSKPDVHQAPYFEVFHRNGSGDWYMSVATIPDSLVMSPRLLGWSRIDVIRSTEHAHLPDLTLLATDR